MSVEKYALGRKEGSKRGEERNSSKPTQESESRNNLEALFFCFIFVLSQLDFFSSFGEFYNSSVLEEREMNR